MSRRKESPESNRADIAILCAGHSRQSIAQSLHVDKASISQAITGKGQKRGRLRHRIEKLVGAPIWTDPSEFSDRKVLADGLGFDPMEKSVVQLRSFVRRKGIRTRSQSPDREELMEALTKHHAEQIHAHEN